MPDCTLPVDLCLPKRRRAMSYPPGDPRNFLPSPCLSCRTGLQRQMERWTVEPDEPPRQPHKRLNIPCADCRKIVKVPSTSPARCADCWRAARQAERIARLEASRCPQCGGKCTPGSGKCQICHLRDRNAPKPCVMRNCKNKARRKGLCDAHWWAMRPEEQKRKHLEAAKQSSKKYREKAHRIRVFRRAHD